MSYVQDIRRQVGHTPLIMTSASGALIEDGKILLQERADTGDWGFPGGYMEYGDTFKDTVCREFLEDAGIAVNPVKLIAMQDDDIYTYPNGDIVQPVNAFYLVERAHSGHQKPDQEETLTTRFFDPEQPPHFFNRQHAKMWDLAVATLTN
jgi:8-oxo-dGTP pyrophosphatase MutT (NUDIX family)